MSAPDPAAPDPTAPEPAVARIAARLARLRAEHEQGRDMLDQLEAQVRELRDQLSRISGAIAVCEELLLDADT